MSLSQKLFLKEKEVRYKYFTFKEKTKYRASFHDQLLFLRLHNLNILDNWSQKALSEVRQMKGL